MTVGQIDFLNVFSSCTAEADESMVSESSCHIFTSHLFSLLLFCSLKPQKGASTLFILLVFKVQEYNLTEVKSPA